MHHHQSITAGEGKGDQAEIAAMSECGAGWVEVVHRGPSVSGEGRRDSRWAKHTTMMIYSFFLAFPRSSTLPSQPYTLFRSLLCL